MYAADLRLAIEYDLEKERLFDYGGLSTDMIIQHIARFTADLWQIHAFAEGNTRTTAGFVIQYLRSLGFKVNNDIFAKNAWYFRNAMVRYVYKNNAGVLPEPKYVERFFRNLLLGEQWDLKNRYLIINPPSQFAVQPLLDTPTSTPTGTPTSTPTSIDCYGNMFLTENENIHRLVMALGDKRLSVKEIMEAVGLKDRKNFLEYTLNPAIASGFVNML